MLRDPNERARGEKVVKFSAMNCMTKSLSPLQHVVDVVTENDYRKDEARRSKKNPYPFNGIREFFRYY